MKTATVLGFRFNPFGFLLGVIGLVNFSALAVTLTVNNGSGSGTYTSGAVVNITANPPPTGYTFDKWTGASIGLPLSSNTTLTMPPVNTAVTARYKTVVEPSWELWADTGNGLLSGVFTTLAITTNHDIFYTFWSGPQTGAGRVCKATGDNPHYFSLLASDGFVLDTGVQNNVSGLALNVRGEPIAAAGSTIGSTTSNVNWLYHYSDSVNGGGPGWLASTLVQNGNYFYTTRMIDSDPLTGVCWVVGESPALWRSLDGGDTFTAMPQQTKLPSNLRGGGPPMSREFAVSIIPPTVHHPLGAILTAGENDGVVCSFDQATNWTSVDPNYLNPVSPLARVHPSYDGSVPNQVLTGGGDMGGLGWRPDGRIIVQSASAFGYGGIGTNGTGGSDAVHLYSFLLDRPDLPAVVGSGIPNGSFAGGQGVQSQSIRTTTSGWTFVETPYAPAGGHGGIYMSADGIHWTNVAAGINYPMTPKASGGIASGGKSSIAVDGNDVFMSTIAAIYHFVPSGTNQVSGMVRDGNDQPVTNAIVRTAYGNWTVTAIDGSYAITNIGDSRYPITVSVSAPGLAFASQSLMVIGGTNELDFVGETSVLASISVTSPLMSVAAGGTMSFTAIAKDQFDHPLQPQPPITWSTSDDASISNGFYTTLPGQETFVSIFATSGNVSGVGYANGVLVPIPFITSLSTNRGSVYGGTSLTIIGGNFPPNAAVLFGGVLVYGATVTSTSISCVTPDVSRSPTYGTGGLVPVNVVNQTTGSGSLPNGFNCVVTSPQTFLATITGGSSGGQTQISRAPGALLSLVAAAAPTGQVFYAWSGGGSGTFGNVTLSNTTFSMPSHDVSIVATYKFVPTLPQTSVPIIASTGQLITITSATTNADIYYTLDGSEPTTPSSTPNPHGVLYTGAFVVSGTPMIKAVAAAANRPDSVVVTLNSSATPLETWRSINFGNDVLNQAISGNGADPDKDGIPNLIEYGFGLDPHSALLTNLPFSGAIIIGSEKYSTISFARAANATDVTFVVDVSSDLVSWLSGSSYSGGQSLAVTANTTEVSRTTNAVEFITVRDNTPMSTAPKRFMRVRVSWP